MARLSGKTVLITAAAQGIGRASALACAAEGATVIATDINEAGLATLPDDAEPGGRIQIRRLDVTDSGAVARAADGVPDLDGLFNCAGFVHDGTVLEVSDEDLAFSFDLNVGAMVRTTRSFLPGLLRRAEAVGTASILNMSSMAGSVKGFARRAAYGTTKAAVVGLTKSVAAEFVASGLRCNALAPGTVDTPSLRQRIASAADPVAAEAAFIARQPMGRLAETADLTPTIVHLLSDDSRFMTGQLVLVDGGCTI